MSELSEQETARALLEKMDEDVQILTLVTGQLPDGSDHYAYASIPPSKYQAFKEAEAKGNYDLADFGTILAHGPGLAPPAEVEQKMREEYGASHTFEEDMQAMGERMAAVFAEADKK